MPWDNGGNWQDNNQGPWGRKPSSPPPNDLDDLIRQGQEKLKSALSGDSGAPFSPRVIALVLVAFFLLWLSSGIYVINEGEQGVILRFGEYNRTATPGLNYHLPSPIETIIKVNVERTNREEIGFRSGLGGSLSTQRNIPEESLMLTGDENIVDINFEVQWNIKDAKEYLFNVRDNNPRETTVKTAAESAMREVISRARYKEAIEGSGRSKTALETKKLLQTMLDDYGAGVQIHSIQVKKVDPPAQVIDAFRDVQTARADKEREINQAEAYRNDVIPRARGAAAKIEQGAEGYKQQVVAESEGETSRFLSVYEQYKLAKDITKKRIYLETMEDIMNGMDKILLENKDAGVLPYLSIQELRKNKNPTKGSAQ